MIFKSLTIVTLSWTLVAAIILGLVSCDSSSTSDASDGNQQQRSARKYLELDDLNSGHVSSDPVHEFASAEEVDGVEARVVESYARPKKFVKRSAQSTENARPTRQQQLQQQRARNTRQNQQKKQRPGIFWTLARVTFEVCLICYVSMRK